MNGADQLPDPPPDEELPGQDRPPSRWPVRLGAVLVVVAVLAGIVALVQRLGSDDDDPVAAPTSSATARPSSSTPERRIVSPSLTVPAPVRLAIRAAYPGASVAVVSAIVVRNKLVSTRYGARTPQRRLDILIENDRSAFAQVLKTSRTLRFTQDVAGDRISILVTTRKGPTTEKDFLVLEQLIRDRRLTATD